MDIQKAAAWATIGSFVVICISLYLQWSAVHPHGAATGTATQPMTPFHPPLWISLIILLAAGVLHVAAAVLQNKRPLPPAPVSAVASNLAPVPPLPRPPVPVSIPASAEVEKPSFVGTSITPEYLVSAFKEHTHVQARKMIEPFIGKRIRVSGQLAEVLSSTPEFAQVTFSRQVPLGEEYVTIYMYFHTRARIDRLAILRRGDSITVSGRIKEVSAVQIDLDDCDLEG